MALKEAILKIVNKTYGPHESVERKFGRYDLLIKTDAVGRPVLLFLGKKNEQGRIVGERYARRLKEDAQGNILKDHWDLKGKAS